MPFRAAAELSLMRDAQVRAVLLDNETLAMRRMTAGISVTTSQCLF